MNIFGWVIIRDYVIDDWLDVLADKLSDLLGERDEKEIRRQIMWLRKIVLMNKGRSE